MKNKVIMFSGLAGSGKTTAALFAQQELTKKGFDSRIVPLAKSLKNFALEMGWDGYKDEKGRKFLQSLAEVVRDYDINTWVNILVGQIMGMIGGDESGPFIIDDWRYPNEYEVLDRDPNLDVWSVKIYAPNREILKGEAREHPSETSLSDNPDDYDFYIDNTGSLEELREQVYNIVQKVMKE